MKAKTEVMILTPEFISTALSGVFATACGTVFAFARHEKITPKRVMTFSVVGIMVAISFGSAICEHFHLKFSMCLLIQTVLVYVSDHLFVGLNKVGRSFAKNPIMFIKHLKNGKLYDGDE